MNHLKNPRLIVSTLGTIAIALSSYGWWTRTYVPGQEEHAQMMERHAALQDRNEQTRATLADLGVDEMERAIEAYNRQATLVERLVPNASDPAPPLLSLITTSALRHNLWVVQASPVGDGQTDITSPDGSTTRTFDTEGYSVVVRGPYHDVAAYFGEILSVERAIAIRDVAFEAVKLDADAKLPPEMIEEQGAYLRSPGWGIEARFRLVGFRVPAETTAPTNPIS